jgi:predicted metalloprotease with PDZ domain
MLARFLEDHHISCAGALKYSKRFEAEAKLAELKAGFGTKVVKNKGKKPGLKVAKVEVGKALHAAGIKKGDIVLGVNGEKMTTVAKFTALQKILPVRAAWQSQRFLSHAAQYSPLCP